MINEEGNKHEAIYFESTNDLNDNKSSEDTEKRTETNKISPSDLSIETSRGASGVGLMSDSVGTGKYAKTNIIWYIVSATFVVFSCISSAFVVLLIYGYNISELTQSIKDIWGVFTPILTLSLGYLFGKQGRLNKDSGVAYRKNK